MHQVRSMQQTVLENFGLKDQRYGRSSERMQILRVLFASG